MWITPQDEALQAQSGALIAFLISLMAFVLTRNRVWLSIVFLSITALLVTAVVVADLGS